MTRLLETVWIYRLDRKKPSNRALSKKQKKISKLQRKSDQYWTWRRKVFQRDGFQCRECKASTQLEAHHITEWIDNPKARFDVKNGITLCVNCHTKLHPWRIKKYKKYRAVQFKSRVKTILRKDSPYYQKDINE